MAQSREDRLIEAVTGGGLGGALAAYFGNRAFDPSRLADKLLWGAGIGAGVAVVILGIVLVTAKGERRDAIRNFWWIVPAVILFVALVISLRELLGWAFGHAVAGVVEGWRAAVVGGLVGAVVFGGYTWLRTRPGPKPLVTQANAEQGAAADGGRDPGSS